ncbi:hypothetical protein Ddc_21175 [Ditylenchus destructor]|nr:hypothetical protein Ddc_21175 [Ditylenchus destructor]
MSQKLPYTNAVNGGDSASGGHKFEIPPFSLPGIPFSFKHNQLGFPLWEHTTARIDQLCEERLTYLKKYEPLIRYKCGMPGTDALLRMQKEALQSFGRRLEKNDAIRSGHCKKLVEYVESNLGTEYSAWASIKSFFSVMWTDGLDEIK